jgi:hypothetical protein
MLLGQVSSGKEALPVLGQLMSEAGLSIGRSAAAGYRELQQSMSTLVRIDLLPAWEIVGQAAVATSIEAVEEFLVPEISIQLPIDVCHRVLTQIPDLGLDTPIRKVFDIYLQEWRASSSEPELRRSLSDIRLLSMAGKWMPSTELVAGVSGLMPEFSVDENQFQTLRGIACDNRSTPELESPDFLADGGGSAQEQLLQELEEYFEPLVSSSVKPAVGAVIGLFGERVASLAKSWLDPIAYDDYLEKLGWQDPGHEDGPDRRLKWMGVRAD